MENTKDNHIEKALSLKQSGSAFSPSHSLETKSAERVSFQTALPLYHIRVVEVTDEVDVQDNTTTEERNEEAFIVRSGMKDEWNPRKWATSWRIWAT